MYDHILFDIADSVATITLNRPDKLNALTIEMSQELVHAQKQCARESGVRCIVLTGAERAFSAGQDLQEFQMLEGRATVGDHLRRGYHRVVMGFRQLEKPVIGKINGVAAGAALGYALATDLRIASDKASFVPAFIGIGLAPDSGASWFLQQLVGPAKAFELLATGVRLDAQEALRLGIINQVVAPKDLDSTVSELAQRLAMGPTRGIGLTKRVLNKAVGHNLADTLEYEAQIQDIAFNTGDHKEGVAAFLEKRPPQFSGR